ncbi:MAG: hypothetical protein ACYCVB_05705 [Bacilli bacterium]
MLRAKEHRSDAPNLSLKEEVCGAKAGSNVCDNSGGGCHDHDSRRSSHCGIDCVSRHSERTTKQFQGNHFANIRIVLRWMVIKFTYECCDSPFNHVCGVFYLLYRRPVNRFLRMGAGHAKGVIRIT